MSQLHLSTFTLTCSICGNTIFPGEEYYNDGLATPDDSILPDAGEWCADCELGANKDTL